MSPLKTAFFALFGSLLLSGLAEAQTELISVGGKLKNPADLSADDVKALTDEQLLSLSMEDLLSLANKLGVSIDELLNMKSTVAAKEALGPRESPAIITLITDEEIRNTGARDLKDVLMLVPGINFGYDVEGIVSLGTRGIWGHEGKILLMIDGQEMNELLYSTLQFSNHFDVDQIKKIEIMRGPGSCIYGGFAELSVINIITKKSDDYNGGSIAGTLGRMPDANGPAAISFGVGKIYKRMDFSLKGFGGVSHYTDRTYRDFSGFDYPARTGITQSSAFQTNLALNTGDLSSRFIVDFFRAHTTDFLEDQMDEPLTVDFYTALGETKYPIHLSDQWTLTPKFNIKYQTPWNNTSDTSLSVVFYNKSAARTTGNLLSEYDLSEKINLLGGVEGFMDYAASHSFNQYVEPFADGSDNVKYYNAAAFAQALFKLKTVNFVLGGRYDRHNIAGGAFSPRVALTGLVDAFHYKVLFGKAFRAPGIENLNLGQKIIPEKTTVYELELGYRFSSNVFWTTNLFDVTLKDPIIYYADDVSEWYQNEPRTGSAGMETELRFRYPWGNGTLSYSYYSADLLNGRNGFLGSHFDKNKVDAYSSAEAGSLLGFPNHKLAVRTSFPVRGLSVNPSLVFQSSRYAWDEIDTAGNDIIHRLDPTVQLDLYLRYENLFADGLGFGFGAYNLLNQTIDVIQPYRGWHPPYPGPSIEFVLKVFYDVGF